MSRPLPSAVSQPLHAERADDDLVLGEARLEDFAVVGPPGHPDSGSIEVSGPEVVIIYTEAGVTHEVRYAVSAF